MVLPKDCSFLKMTFDRISLLS